MKARHLLSTTLFILPFTQAIAAGYTPFSADEVWPHSAKLPQHEMFESMHEDAKDIASEINGGKGGYKIEYKMKGGSSHQVMVKKDDGTTMGLWSAPNHATYIEGEIFAYTLARLFNRGQWSTHATRMTLTDLGRDAAYTQLSTKQVHRMCNRDTMLAYMDKNPYYINGVYKGFRPGEKPVDVPEIVDRANGKRLNANHFIVKMINKAGPKPTGQTVYLNSIGETLTVTQQKSSIGQANDTELAKQLSFMTLVDALNSQRDRFGIYGSNMQVMYRKGQNGLGSFNISLIDNGGIATASNTLSLKYFLGENGYGPGVSRFEKEVYDRVIGLDDFIQGRTTSFLNYKTVTELKVALGYEDTPHEFEKFLAPASCKGADHTYLFWSLKSLWDKRWSNFTTALGKVAAHMRNVGNDKNAFFN